MFIRRDAPSREPGLPESVRIYAIGDVHGRADLLDNVFRRIDADREAAPVLRPIEVLLGDYVDRGPASREVLDCLIDRRQTREMICLRGNHEIFLSEFLSNPATLDEWLRYGGLETLMSYGLAPGTRSADPARVAAQLRHALPAAHRAFLAELAACFTCGDFFFVHAGIRPGVPLARQDDQDMAWIRHDFLLHEDEFEKVVVHGHTRVVEPDVRANRINIDTGAYATGRLTCLAIEGAELTFI
jgi:serine/threonine protein phosphatase 1